MLALPKCPLVSHPLAQRTISDDGWAREGASVSAGLKASDVHKDPRRGYRGDKGLDWLLGHLDGY